jgi:O-antigen ligase
MTTLMNLMTMTPMHMLALVLIPCGTAAGVIAASWFPRVRDIFFFAMVALAVFAERMDVNFFSEAWYRGTTRGLQVTLIEVLAFSLLVGCWVGRRGPERSLYWPASLGVMLLYFTYAGVSVVMSEPKIYGAFELSKILASMLVFLASAYYVRSRREWTILLAAVGCAVALEGAWAVKQHFITQVDRSPGSLDHPNSLSMYLCLTVPPLVAVACSGWSRPLRWFCAVCALIGAAGIFMTFSRAGIPVFAIVVVGTFIACASWKMTPGRIFVRAMLVLIAAALVAASWGEMVRRFTETSLEEEYLDTSVDGRGVYLRLAAAIAKDHFFGVGLNNWSYRVSRTYGPSFGYRFDDYDNLIAVYGSKNDKIFANSYLAAPAHNLAALTLGELGVPGLVIFALLWIRWISLGLPFLRLPKDEPMRALGVGILFSICGVFGQSLTEWIYRQPAILFTFYVLLGALASMVHSRRLGAAEASPVAISPPEADASAHQALAPEGA